MRMFTEMLFKLYVPFCLGLELLLSSTCFSCYNHLRGSMQTARKCAIFTWTICFKTCPHFAANPDRVRIIYLPTHLPILFNRYDPWVPNKQHTRHKPKKYIAAQCILCHKLLLFIHRKITKLKILDSYFKFTSHGVL